MAVIQQTLPYAFLETSGDDMKSPDTSIARYYRALQAVITAAICMVTIALPSSVLRSQMQEDTLEQLWYKMSTDWDWGEIHDCVIGGDPPMMVAACHGGTKAREPRLVELNIETGEGIRSVISEAGNVMSMSFARNANMVATASPGRITVWRWPEMERTVSIQTTTDDDFWWHMTSAVLNGSGTRVYDAGTGILWDTHTGDTVWRYRNAASRAGATKEDNGFAVFSADDRYLLVPKLNYLPPDGRFGGRSWTTAVLLDAATGSVVDGPYGGGSGDDWISCMALSDDARYIALGRKYEDTEGSIVVYDRVANKKVLNVSDLQRYSPLRLALLPDGKGLLVRTYRGVVDYYRAWDRQPIKRYAFPAGKKFSPDWRYAYESTLSRIFVTRLHLDAVSVDGKIEGGGSILYPNPADGAVTITGLSDGAVTCRVADSAGQLVLQQPALVSGGRCRLVLSGRLSAGAYMLQLQRDATIVFSSPLVLR
ncbi:MAG: hypothetical protein HRU79_05415 [Ignavibacteria bacterium]|nr:MAG: hypothetical protein HRU79_05415 [Ignavibacteria bacterium]